jgi:RND family efflux transporter MFP subunit
VEAGHTLALIEPPLSDLLANLVEAEAGVVRAKLDLELAEMALARVEKLAGLELKPAREREEAEFARRAARSRHDAALALRAAYDRAGVVFASSAGEDSQPAGLPAVELKAPLSGLIIEVAAALGEHVPAGRAVFTVLDPERVHIEARIPEFDIGRAGAPTGALYELPGEPGRFEPVVVEGAGRAVFSSPEIDPATRTASWVYEVKNPEGRLKIGMALTLHLETRRAEEALAIPESAVVEEEGRPVAFVQVAGETFENRSLTLGIRDGGWVQVIDGLQDGERVVTREAYAIRLAAAAGALPAHGHEH